MIFTAEALVTDLDGVLANSNAVVERAWKIWSAERGLEEKRVLRVAHGRRTIDVLRIVAPELESSAEVARLVKLEEQFEDDVVPVSGAAEFVREIPRGRWAVATSGEEHIARTRLRRVGIVPPPVLVTAEMVSRGKPDPEVYARAAKLLGVDPRECIAFEDAPAGISAAVAAGMAVVALLTTYPASELCAAAGIVSDFHSVRLSEQQRGPALRIELATS
ncbi:MAG: HAD-IA family hydrolase [Candidatus Eremiobacteraeota bacterium]|nr:HAD-IA family hydrolase [Candidatus Eremiobacteraeota bacterium]